MANSRCIVETDRRTVRNRFQAEVIKLLIVVHFGLSTLLRVGVPAVSGGVAGMVGLSVYRWSRQGEVRSVLARPFIALAAVVAGLGVVHVSFHLVTPLATRLNGTTAFLAVLVPWLVFAARYAGFGRYVTRRRIVAGTVVVGVLLCVSVVTVLVEEGRLDTVSAGTLDTLQTATSVVSLCLLLLVFALIGSAVVTTYRHDRLPTAQGVVVTLPIAGYLFAVGSASTIHSRFRSIDAPTVQLEPSDFTTTSPNRYFPGVYPYKPSSKKP